MSVLQNIVLAASTVKMRWQEPYITSGLNEKSLAAFPKGVVAGFKVVPSSGYSIEIQVDPVLGLSIANVVDTTGATKFGVTINQPSSVYVDLTAQAGTTVFIALDAQYSVGASSAAQIRVVDAAELLLNVDLIILAKVNVPATPVPGPPVTAANINMGYRTSSGDAVGSEARPPVNLINNGSFERDTVGTPPVGWSNYVGIGGPSLSPVVVNSVARTGTQALQLSSGVAANSGFGSTPVSMEVGQTARASVWLRSTGGSPITGGNGVVCYVVFLDADYSEIGATQLEAAFTGGSTTFEQRAGLVTAPVGTAYAQLLVTFYNCSGTLYVDDAELVARSPEALAQSAVFGGSASSGDNYHTHTSAGMSYAGSAVPFSGWTLPGGTVEATFDQIVADLGAVSGATRIGNAPSKILSNVFVNTVANGVAIDAQGGPPNGHGVIGRGAVGGNGSGVIGYGRGAGVGGAFVGEGAVMPAYSGQGLVAAGSDTLNASSTGLFALGGLPSGYGVHGRARGAGWGVYGEAISGSGSGVVGRGIGSGSGGTFYTGVGAAAVDLTAALNGIGQGNNTKGVWGVGTGTEPAYYGTTGGGHGITLIVNSGNGDGANLQASGSGAGVRAFGGSTSGSGVVATGGSGGGYGVYAVAQGGNTPGVFGRGNGSTGAIVAQGDPDGIGTNTVRPNGFGGGGGPGAANGLTTSQGGDGADIQGGSAEQLPPIDSASGPYWRGSAGHGVIGRAGTGRVGGHGVYGFGSVGFEAYESDPAGEPGWGVFGQGAASYSDVSNAPYAHAGGGVIGVGGDSDFQLLAGHGVRGQNGTDVFPFGGDGACFIATPTTTSAKALLIDNVSSRHGAIAYKNARPMTCVLSGFDWTPFPYVLQGGANGFASLNYTTGIGFTAFAIGVQNDASTQFRLPLNAVITGVTFCLSHNGQANFHASGFGVRVSKRWPSGAALGGVQGNVVNQGIRSLLSAGASVQALALTLSGSVGDRTVTATDQVFTVVVDTLSITATAYWDIYYMKIDYNMFDYLYLP